MSALDFHVRRLRENLARAEAELASINSSASSETVQRSVNAVERSDEITRQLKSDLAELEELLKAQRELPSA